MHGVWRPERRNRKIGTKSSGFSKSNDMRIPESWLDKYGNCSLYYERLERPEVEQVAIAGRQLTLLYEAPHNGFSFGCSPSDVIKMLASLSKLVPALPSIIAFRQPTRKQRQQNPVWGRFLYFAEFGGYCGTAIVLEAQELGAPLKWSKRMTLEDRAEYDLLIRDGHPFLETKRYYVAELTEEAVRNTKLYRTFLHELGHLADFHQKVLDNRTALDPDQDVADSLYFSRPTSEREAFAHRFAEELRETLLENCAIPFAPQPFAKADF
ncbi:hypothetical protein [Ruegeria arenilitoris]|uniref:hypothetical protein n=1 Tax=Ruegeria arenilitoris TaxID=1173585 RepID=UPI001480A358|nr:hypothetical protein [Ruegeria arenilitoris]